MTMTVDADGDNTTFPGSVIFDININQFGAALKNQAGKTPVFRYIQIVNGTGHKIQPAYQKFIDEQQTNPIPGTIFFRGLRENQPLVPCGGLL
jgi:hypothetical protein